ncbi:MAG: hypothetical protein IH594_15755 [Bacteroidales bacterium]|nr:hypothetical protein [Bacteroidales bacterium]
MFDTAACQNVVFDAGHNNFHDILTTYAPIASLLHSDGILISRQEGLFTQESLDAVDLLIIANAMSSENDDKKQVSAFKSYESQVLIDWIE